MKTMNPLTKTLAVLLILVSSKVIAQDLPQPSINNYTYKNAFGLRLGETSGLTYKHLFGSSNAFEAIVGLWPYRIGLTGLLEKNINAGAPGLTFYYGGGAHVNVGDTKYRRYYSYSREDYVYTRTSEFAFGIDGIIGIEYKFKPVPFAVSTDIKPFIESNQNGNTYLAIDPSIGVKLTF